MKWREFIKRLNRGEILMDHKQGEKGYILYCALRRVDMVYPYMATYTPGKPLRIDMLRTATAKYGIEADAELPGGIKPLTAYSHIFDDPEGAIEVIVDLLQDADDEQDFVRGFREDDFYFYADDNSIGVGSVIKPQIPKPKTYS